MLGGVTDSVLPAGKARSRAQVRLIAGYSDYFRFPQVQHFESVPHLLTMLPETNFFEAWGEQSEPPAYPVMLPLCGQQPPRVNSLKHL